MSLKYLIFEYEDGTFKVGDSENGPYGYGFGNYDDALKLVKEFQDAEIERNKKPIKVHTV